MGRLARAHVLAALAGFILVPQLMRMNAPAVSSSADVGGMVSFVATAENASSQARLATAPGINANPSCDLTPDPILRRAWKTGGITREKNPWHRGEPWRENLEANRKKAGKKEAALRAELAITKVSTLQKRARDAGVDGAKIEEAVDAEEPRQVLIDLIIDKEASQGGEKARKKGGEPAAREKARKKRGLSKLEGSQEGGPCPTGNMQAGFEAARVNNVVTVSCPVQWKWTVLDRAITKYPGRVPKKPVPQTQDPSTPHPRNPYRKYNKDGRKWQADTGQLFWNVEAAASGHELTMDNEVLEIVCGEQRRLFYRVVPRLSLQDRAPPGGLSIYMLVIDSMSDQDVDEFLPKTVDATETAATHTLFRFRGATTVRTCCSTNGNIGPLFSGIPYNPDWDYARAASKISPWYNSKPGEGVDLDGHLLHDNARNFGYITAKTSSLYGDYMAARYWNSSSFDHVMPSKINMEEEEQFLKAFPMCIATRRSCEYDSEYLVEFAQAYPGRRKFVFAHFTEGHAKTSNGAQLDSCLPGLLQALLADENAVLLLMTDHGGSPFERTAMRLLLPNWLLTRHPEINASLVQNTQQWTTHYDTRRTILDLFSYSGSKEPEISTGGGVGLRAFGHQTVAMQDTGHLDAQSLLHSIPWWRDCTADIADETEGSCPCVSWTALAVDDAMAVRAMQMVFHRANVNNKKQSLSSGKDLHAETSSCRVLTAGKILVARAQNPGPSRTTVYIEFTSSESTYAKWEATVSISAKEPEKLSSVMATSMMTRYQVYEHCADSRVHPKFCVCGGESEGTL